MTVTNNRSKMSCNKGCLHCLSVATADGVVTGWPMALAAAGIFLGPIVSAIAAAGVFRGSDTGQFFGALCGLCCGVMVAALITRTVGKSRPSKEAP